ncbi:GNAT family N-acetyltransferase [Rhodophyticola sp. CCM32]|uniref:GNAT family N-acetyltransferase n=1 Tax=Rhodophyticola sp. CCM32 TaxID=2916397 RepID=UPI00107F141F|nr:GNAT family N-acetyltransferase [Rhodophyticola sp. CCM32]QBY01031.1 GNAT family N-acetyltransferase [Rhodophyticola sp. CCM32]
MMPQNNNTYTFRKLTRADYPLIEIWLSQPHIGGWWGKAAAEIALMEEDIDNGPTDMRIVALDGHPFAFVQDYPAHHWPAPHFADLPADARAMDTFLGDPAFLGKGHARAYLRQRATDLMGTGTRAVAIDPDPTNTRAIVTYTAAGFDPVEERDCGDGDRVLVMLFRRQMARPAPPALLSSC